MPLPLTDMIVAVLASDGVERLFLEAPVAALRRAGATVHLIAPAAGEIIAVEDHDRSAQFAVDRRLGDVDSSSYDAVLVPGWSTSSRGLLNEPGAAAFVKAIVDEGKPAAASGRGLLLFAGADVVRGRAVAAPFDAEETLKAAGARVAAASAVVDGTVISAAGEAGLATLTDALLEQLRTRDRPQLVVDEAGAESFPASDPPSWTSTSIGPDRRETGG